MTTEVPTQVTRWFTLDTQLNQTAFDLVTYSAIGYTIGIGVSILFKRKQFPRNLCAGLGAGYQFNENCEAFNVQRNA